MAFLLLVAGDAEAQTTGNWSLNVSVQRMQGQYMFDTVTSAYYFYGNLRYQAQRWAISVSVPVIVQNSDLMSFTGGMYLPTGKGHHSDQDRGRSHHDGDMGGDGSEAHMNAGLGDVFAYTEYALLPERGALPGIFAGGSVKFPTANLNYGFGTGEFDFGVVLAMRKNYRLFSLYMDLGYTVIGDPADVDYIDPINLGIGLGKFFSRGRHSLLLYYQTYTTVFDGFDSPQQVSVGYSSWINPRLALSFTVLAGLSETSPDFGFSGGFSLGL